MKKIKRYHLTVFMFMFAMLISISIAMLLQKSIIAVTIVPIILIVEYLFVYLEGQKLKNTIIPLINNKEYDKALSYLKQKENKYFFVGNYKANLSNMILVYAVLGNLKEAKEVITKHNLYNNKNLYYILFQISLSENNLIKAKEYAEKILKIKNEKLIPQKNSVQKIIKMIETGIFDEEIFKNTTYPFIKELCLKYQNNTDIKFDNNCVEPMVKINHKKRSITWLGIILLILSIMALYSLLIAMSIVAPTTNTEMMYFISQTFKYAWVLMLIPIASILFGFIYRKKGYSTLGNIIVGFVSLIFLFGMGILSNSFDIEKTQDVAVLNNIHPLEEASLPKDVVIYTIEEEYYRETFVRFNNHIEFNDFYNSLEKRWKTEYNFAVEKKVMEYLGSLISLGTDYYILYSATLDEYNINHIYLNQYYVFIQIDIEGQTMIIKEICVLDYE